MNKVQETVKKCANPGCGRTTAAGKQYCDNCELEWTLYRRDLRDLNGREREKEGLVLESR